MSRLVATPHPFETDHIDCLFPDGSTVAEIVAVTITDPVYAAHAHIYIGDQYIPRHLWHRVRPKPGATIYLKVVAHGGGGGGGKNPLRTVLTIAVIAASFYAGPILGAALSPTGAAGASFFGSLTYGQLGGAIIGVAGYLATNAIAPVRPPSLANLSQTQTTRDSPTLFIEGARNGARPFSTVPVVLGVHKNVPPLGVQTYTEVVGDDNYLRMLVVWGYGPLKIENIKIGETPIQDFDDVTIETREGRAGDAAITIIPDQVAQDDFSILLAQASDWQTRSAQPDADELSVDITFPSGLVQFNDQGGRGSRSVAVQIQYRLATGGSPNPWLTPTFTANTGGSVAGDTVTFTANRTSAIRHGLRWSVGTRGDYEIRIRRTTNDTDDTQIFDQVQWTALRAITDEDPINFAHPLAITALSIKATDQLNRAVDELSATTSSYVERVTDDTEVVSSNPADLYRHVLQGAANAKALTDARVDIDKLQDWYAFCVTNGFEFNMIRDFQASVWDTLADIAAAGRASPAMIDGKWSVVVDEEQTVPVQHFTPRNSWGFEAEKNFPDQPHAFRIRFSNRDKDWRQDERIVYADGYTAANATDFEGLDAPGVTDPDHIWKFGRFQIAQAELRPERWTFNTDFEFLVARRGDLVVITHDVLLVGLASGRIKEVHTGGSPEQITGVTVDETLTMEAGTDYGVSIRTVTDAEVTRTLVTDAGDQHTVTFTVPLPEGTIAVGDLFGFGVLGSETIEGLILSIEPNTELSARITCIPASPAVYDADTGTIPAFDSKLTALPTVPVANITNIRSDESVLQLGSGDTLIPHIGLSVERPDTPLNVSLDVQMRATGTGEGFYNADLVSVQGSDYLIGNVEQTKTYDLRVRWRDPARLPGVWTYVYGHRVVGQANPPSGLTGATISVFGGNALIRWERLNDLDVRFGGEVRFRHSPETDPDLALWTSSTSIGTAAKGDALFATLPLKPGTYLARVFDRQNRPSATVVVLATKQASVLTYVNVDTVTESPTFTGVKTNVAVDGSSLKLAGLGSFDDIPDFDAIADLDSYGGIASSGTYMFAGGFDLTTVQRVRLTSTIEATSVNTLDRIDERTAFIDSWEDFDGTTQSAADCRVQVRHTDGDPAGSPVAWSAWNDLDSAEFEARGFEFRAQLTTDDPAFNIRVDTLSVVAENI